MSRPVSAVETCIGRGTGTELEPVENDLAGTPVLLVNPRIPLSTGPVFAGWDGVDRRAAAHRHRARNRLGRAQRSGTVGDAALPGHRHSSAVLSATGARLARMSGSGATCFALYRERARRAMPLRPWSARNGRDWWQLAGQLAVSEPRGLPPARHPALRRHPGGFRPRLEPRARRYRPWHRSRTADPAHRARHRRGRSRRARWPQRPGSAAFQGNVSRLVCDFNREEHAPALIPIASDGHAIPGNALDHAGHLARLERFYHPYHERCAACSMKPRKR